MHPNLDGQLKLDSQLTNHRQVQQYVLTSTDSRIDDNPVRNLPTSPNIIKSRNTVHQSGRRYQVPFFCCREVERGNKLGSGLGDLDDDS